MRKLRCLFIEDSQTDVEIMEWELKKKGIQLEYIIVETENELNFNLTENGFDLIVSDHNMPCLDSITALAMCKALAPQIPFVVLSMYLPEGVADSLEKNGVNAVVEKYGIEKFFLTIQQLVLK